MRARLLRAEIAGHLAALQQRSTLTALQSARLSAILDTLAEDGRFLLRAALEAAEFPAGDARGQEAFQDFRKRVNQAAAEAGVDLRLELDSRKVPPDQRYGWFTGGDLVDEGIASFTGQAAGRTGIDHPVTPEVVELWRSRVYVSFFPTTNVMARKVDMLLRQLREALALDPEQSWEVADSSSVGLGEDPEATRERLCAQADVRLVLVSPAYLAGAAPERRRALEAPGRLVAFALSGLPEGPLDLGPLHLHDIRRRSEPWDELTRTEQRRRYVSDVVDEIRRALRPLRVSAEERTGGPPDGVVGEPGPEQATWGERSPDRARVGRDQSSGVPAGPLGLGARSGAARGRPAGGLGHGGGDGGAAAVRAARRRRHGQDNYREAVHPAAARSARRRRPLPVTDPVRPARRPDHRPGRHDDARPHPGGHARRQPARERPARPAVRRGCPQAAAPG